MEVYSFLSEVQERRYIKDVFHRRYVKIYEVIVYGLL